MKLSVVILNYNVKHFLELCICSVQKAISTIDAEIIVVDNASEDGSVEMMQKRFPDITYVYNTENTGFPKGNNIGVAKAKGAYLCILNPDTIVPEDIFNHLADRYSKLDRPGILGCKLIDGKGHFLPESKRSTPTPWVAFTKISGLHRLFSNNDKIKTYYATHLNQNQEGKTDILVGAFMFMKTELYRELGGFDERCFMYADDIDLSYRSLQRNRHNYYVPSVQVIHFKGESTSKDEKYLHRFKEAMTFFYKKHLKVPFWFHPVMNMGIALFARKKTKESGVSLPKVQQYILISKNRSIFDRLQKMVEQPVHIISLENWNDVVTSSDDERTEILIDADVVSYKKYIDLVTENRSRKYLTFKIKPQNSDFFIGSNDKNGRGEIIRV